MIDTEVKQLQIYNKNKLEVQHEKVCMSGLWLRLRR